MDPSLAPCGGKMKVKFTIFIENQGDGSVRARFFRTETEAEQFAQEDDERFCEDIQVVELEFDERGLLV